MARLLPDEFEGRKLSPLAIASRATEAKEIESALDDAGIDYTFEITPLPSTNVVGILFGAAKKGVLFLVPSEDIDFCKTTIMEAGLSNLLID